MNFLDLAKKRYSCRKYDTKPIEDDKLNLILEAGRVAPSAVNYQPWHFIVIRDKKNLKRIHPVYHRDWYKKAPCLIIICGDHNRSWIRKDGKDHCDIDIAITVDHITLQAAELGLGTCWVCNFDKDLCIELLNLPQNLEPIVIVPLGYPLDPADPDRHKIKRKPVGEIVSYENYK
jgi:nitroreductase